jgi:uncharacterized protein YebE (UPF0316 family)
MIELLSGPWGPVIIFFLRLVDVSMSTFRVLMVVRGSRWLAPLVSFFEILIWVIAAGVVIRNLGSPLHAVGYAAGFSAGTAVGMWIEGKLALGICSIRAISRDPQRELASELRSSGYGVTEQRGRGREGTVGILHAVVRRRDIHDVIRTIERHDPDAFVTVQNDAVVHRGWLYRAKRK